MGTTAQDVATVTTAAGQAISQLIQAGRGGQTGVDPSTGLPFGTPATTQPINPATGMPYGAINPMTGRSYEADLAAQQSGSIIPYVVVGGVALLAIGYFVMRRPVSANRRRMRRNTSERPPKKPEIKSAATGYWLDEQGVWHKVSARRPTGEAYKAYLRASRAKGPSKRSKSYFESNRRSSRVRRNAKPKMSELGVYAAVGAVREARPKEHSALLPPGVAAKFKKLPPGLYKYGYGPKKGESIVRFKTASLLGAMTSTRIGASKVGEYHWVVDNWDPSFPVVIRGIDNKGKSYFRVEEYAKAFTKVPVYATKKKTAK
jgi:hypothetical protein